MPTLSSRHSDWEIHTLQQTDEEYTLGLMRARSTLTYLNFLLFESFAPSASWSPSLYLFAATSQLQVFEVHVSLLPGQ